MTLRESPYFQYSPSSCLITNLHLAPLGALYVIVADTLDICGHFLGSKLYGLGLDVFQTKCWHFRVQTIWSNNQILMFLPFVLSCPSNKLLICYWIEFVKS